MLTLNCDLFALMFSCMFFLLTFLGTRRGLSDPIEGILQGMETHHFTKDAECNFNTFFDLALALFSFRHRIQN